MFDNIYKRLTKNHVRNYFVFCLWLLLYACFFTKVILGWTFEALGFVYLFVLFLGITTILYEVFIYFVVLKILKVNVKYLRLHKQVVAIIIVGLILYHIFGMLLYNMRTAVRIINLILGIAELICCTYIVSKKYKMCKKKTIYFAVINLIILLLDNILLGIYKGLN